jgi:hypothetical protein
MANPTLCTVSGVIRDLSGDLIEGVTVVAVNQKPFIHPTDGSLIMPFVESTMTDGSGNWSLTLVETTTPNVTITISIIYTITASSGPGTPGIPTPDQRDYTVQIPNATTANFSTLISGEL